MRKLLHFGAGFLGVLAVVVLLSPWLLYELGLSRFDTMPAKPAQMVTAEQQAWVWRLVHGTGQPKLERMSPYGVAWRLVSGDQPSVTPGETLAYWMARDYVWRLPRRNMSWWHLTTGAMTIWLTRNWSAEELASAAYPVMSQWPPGKVLVPAGEVAGALPAR
ncbi:hypothetical protein [Roseateles sp.]|uniref:hypothetical protein n=1 Tax=Roseateles sp. TaxID=1971397 RepID=UPI00326653D2